MSRCECCAAAAAAFRYAAIAADCGGRSAAAAAGGRVGGRATPIGLRAVPGMETPRNRSPRSENADSPDRHLGGMEDSTDSREWQRGLVKFLKIKRIGKGLFDGTTVLWLLTFRPVDCTARDLLLRNEHFSEIGERRAVETKPRRLPVLVIRRTWASSSQIRRRRQFFRYHLENLRLPLEQRENKIYRNFANDSLSTNGMLGKLQSVSSLLNWRKYKYFSRNFASSIET